MERKLRSAAVALSQRLGRYADWHAAEHQTRQAEAVWFDGDIPPTAGTEMNQYRVVLAHPRPLVTGARGLAYTERGMAWVAGRLERRYSFQEIGLRQIWERPRQIAATYARASILQSQTPCTYGDWMSEHVVALALAMKDGGLVEPLLMPGWWFDKPYVQRDLAVLGIRAEAVREPVLIEEATVLNKTRPGHYWTADEAAAVMTAMQIRPQACRPGTAIYLSRKGEKGEGPKRQINNDVTEAAMVAAGVEVVRTAGCTAERFRALADSTETVFGDHGSALYNMMYWQTRRIVEFFTPDYWDSAFLFLAESLGIRDYHLWQIDGNTSVEGLTSRISTLRSRQVAMPAHARGDKPSIS